MEIKDIMKLSIYKISTLRINSEAELFSLLSEINLHGFDSNESFQTKLLKSIFYLPIAIINSVNKKPELKDAIFDFIDNDNVYKLSYPAYFLLLSLIYELFYHKDIYIFIEYTTKLISKLNDIFYSREKYESFYRVGVKDALFSYLKIILSSEKKASYIDILDRFLYVKHAKEWLDSDFGPLLVKKLLEIYDNTPNFNSYLNKRLDTVCDLMFSYGKKIEFDESILKHRNFIRFLVDFLVILLKRSEEVSCDLLAGLKDNFGSFLNILKERVGSSDVVFKYYRERELGRFLLYLAGSLSDKDFRNSELRSVDKYKILIPYLPEEKFYLLYKKLAGSVYSVVLLNYPYVEKDKKLMRELLKMYLSSFSASGIERKLREPRIKIPADVIRELSDQKLVVLILRSFETSNHNNSHLFYPVCFDYDKEAIEEIEKRSFKILLETDNKTIREKIAEF
ncbi:MAG: hypothetical protein ACK4F9_07005, partial [Brevinematia bacterium]